MNHFIDDSVLKMTHFDTSKPTHANGSITINEYSWCEKNNDKYTTEFLSFQLFMDLTNVETLSTEDTDESSFCIVFSLSCYLIEFCRTPNSDKSSFWTSMTWSILGIFYVFSRYLWITIICTANLHASTLKYNA